MTIAPLMPAAGSVTAPCASSAPPSRPRLRRVRFEPQPGRAPAALRTTSTGRPPVAVVDQASQRIHGQREIARILRLALEVLDRRRSWTQLDRHFAQAPLRCWRVAVARRRPLTQARPGRMHVCMPRADVAEVALPCEMDGRVRALAARFERTAGGWRCTAIRLG